MSDYDPRLDSSPNTESWRPGYRNNPPGLEGVILDRRDLGDQAFRACGCGCTKPVAKKARFRIGHDQRLKGILTRAHLADAKIHLLLPDEGVEHRTAIEDASYWSTPKLDWELMLISAAAKQEGRS